MNTPKKQVLFLNSKILNQKQKNDFNRLKRLNDNKGEKRNEFRNKNNIRAMLKNLIKYGEYIGLTISEDIKEISRMIGEKENDRIAREAMGLPIYPLQ